MDQPYEYMRSVEDPKEFIRANLEAKPSGLRHLLRQMQSRKRVGKTAIVDKSKLERANLSAFERTMKRRQGDMSVLLEETSQEKELRKQIRFADQTQRIPGSYQRHISVQKYSTGATTVGAPSLRGSIENSLYGTAHGANDSPSQQANAMMLESNDYNGRFTRKRPVAGTREGSQRNLPLHKRIVNQSQEFVSVPAKGKGSIQVIEPFVFLDSQSNSNIIGDQTHSRLLRNQDTHKNLTEMAAQNYQEVNSVLSNSKSTTSTLRPDIQRLKNEHLAFNLNKNIQSQASMAIKDQDTLSHSDRYELKANQFHQYFPQPPKMKTQQEELDEERERLGLKKTQHKRNSLYENDEVPRYEISKLETLAKIDLDETTQANQEATDEQYGDATTALFDEMNEQYRQKDADRSVARKQLESNRQTFLDFVKERTDRRNSMSPSGDDSAERPKDKRILLGQQFSSNVSARSNRNLPRLPSKNKLVSEYSSFLSSQAGNGNSGFLSNQRFSDQMNYKNRTQLLKKVSDQVRGRAKNTSELRGNTTRSPDTSHDLAQRNNNNLSRSPSNDNQSFLFGKMVDSVMMADSGDSKMAIEHHRSTLLPSLGRGHANEKNQELDNTSNFYREQIQRNSLSDLLKQAENDGASELRSAKNLKQLKYMTNMYRQKIFKIGDSLNVGVPRSIRQQAGTDAQQSRIKQEILKRSPRRNHKQSATHLFKRPGELSGLINEPDLREVPSTSKIQKIPVMRN